MKKTTIWIISGMVSALLINGSVSADRADGSGKNRHPAYQKFVSDREGGEKRERHRHRKDRRRKHHVSPPRNAVYTDACGACHVVYPPDLLPAGSWSKILGDLDDHFGETVDLDQAQIGTIAEYLKTHSAENAETERSVKVMRSLGADTPIRITEVPYIQAKHRKISREILKRDSIGSLSNCSACHLTAEKGIYDDDNVKLPR